MIITELSPGKDLLLLADLFRLTGKGFSYPDLQNVNEVRSISAQLVKEEGLSDKLKALLNKLYEESREEEVRREYSRIFLSGGLPVSESFVTGRFDSVSDVSAFYKAFGFSPKSGEVPDALMYELEFMALLAVKVSIAPGETEREVTLKAIDMFYEQHLSDFVVKFEEKLNAVNPSEFYKTLTEIIRETITLYSGNKNI